MKQGRGGEEKEGREMLRSVADFGKRKTKKKQQEVHEWDGMN